MGLSPDLGDYKKFLYQSISQRYSILSNWMGSRIGVQNGYMVKKLEPYPTGVKRNFFW